MTILKAQATVRNRSRMYTAARFSVLALLAACGNDFTQGPIVVPDLNGMWSVSLALGASLDGSWTCSETSQGILTISQISDLFSGTTTGGAAGCQSTDGLTETVSFNQYAILNGVVDPVGNLAFNWRDTQQTLSGLVSENRRSMQGNYNLSFQMPPGIMIFFAGTWTATKN